MDLLLFWLSVIGTLLLGSFCLHALNIRNMRAAAWYGGIGAICLVLLFVLQLGRDFFSPATIDARQVDGPVLSIDRYPVDYVLDANGKITALAFRAIVKNSGRTVANNVRMAINLIAEPKASPRTSTTPTSITGIRHPVSLLSRRDNC